MLGDSVIEHGCQEHNVTPLTETRRQIEHDGLQAPGETRGGGVHDAKRRVVAHPRVL
jgi:hypothetical protein